MYNSPNWIMLIRRSGANQALLIAAYAQLTVFQLHDIDNYWQNDYAISKIIPITLWGLEMDKQSNNALRDKIVEEMTVDYSSALEKHFDLAKRFICHAPTKDTTS